MGVPCERFESGDVWMDYEFEDVLFRYEFNTRLFFRKFYGDAKEASVPHDNRLLNDAIRFGEEVDCESYHRGKPRN